MSMKEIIYYKVGGTVRDELMGLKPKDIDLVAIGGNFSEVVEDVKSRGGKVFLEVPDFLTMRCLMPDIGPCDIRLARKDGHYNDGRRPSEVFVAESLYEDSLTRDCTINAMYKNVATGEIIDYHYGKDDLTRRIIRAVGNPEERIKEDALRLLRYFRFSIVKNFRIEYHLANCYLYGENTRLLKNVSPERIREEIYKCFQHDMHETLRLLMSDHYKYLYQEIFNDRTKLWLKPTSEEK